MACLCDVDRVTFPICLMLGVRLFYYSIELYNLLQLKYCRYSSWLIIYPFKLRAPKILLVLTVCCQIASLEEKLTTSSTAELQCNTRRFALSSISSAYLRGGEVRLLFSIVRNEKQKFALLFSSRSEIILVALTNGP